VTSVADGDTVGLSDGRKIRILGIDTPETVKPGAPVDCYGPQASAFARDTLLHNVVTVVNDPTQDTTDRYGRTLAYLVLPDGRNYSILAAEAGVARSYVYSNPVQKHPDIVAAEHRAQQAHRGLWGHCEASHAPAAKADKPNGPDKPSAVYPNCAAARAANVTPLHQGEPGYAKKLDRDGDGVACE
jgi:micrococcal nuclease